MKTLRREQTTAPHAHGVLRLLGSEVLGSSEYLVSPYFQTTDPREEAPSRDKNILVLMIDKCIAVTLGSNVQDLAIRAQFYAGSVWSDEFNIDLPDTTKYGDKYAIRNYANQAILDYCTAYGYTAVSSVANIIWPDDQSIPMYVGGVAKNNTYSVVAAPAVAGGAGVARFYIDSNGDGTGTAPSAVFASSLQAVVVNTTASYLPQSVTVDTNRKYIDVKMGQLATGLAGIIPILTGAVANAANGTTVNCLVLVQK